MIARLSTQKMAGKLKRPKRGGAKRQGRRAGARRHRSKVVRLSLKSLRVLFWNVASVEKRRPDLDKLIYSADIVALQESRLGMVNRLQVTGFHSFYNRRHFGQVILVREGIDGVEIDMSE